MGLSSFSLCTFHCAYQDGLRERELVSSWRNIDRSETLMEFSIAVFFSSQDEFQSVENLHNLRVTRVVEFNVPSSRRPSIVDVVLNQFI